MTTTTPHSIRPSETPQEAYRQANLAYASDPENPQIRRALGWALANLLKDVSGQADASPVRMLKGLMVVSEFPMDATDSRWRESVLWSVSRFLLRVPPVQLPFAQLAGIISRSRRFVGTDPSLARSVWWKALLRHTAAGIDWLGLFDELGWEGGFRPEDEEPELLEGEKRIAPLVERLAQAVSKQLLQTVPLTDEQAEPWLAHLTNLQARHSDWQYLPYYHARLLQQLNRPDEALRVFLPVARQKKNEFWVWSLLADLLAADGPEPVLACYARALTLGTPEPFLVKVRQQLASLLIRLERWNDARAEIDKLVQTRRTEKWPIPAEVERWMNDSYYTQAIASDPWYESLCAQADALLWTDSTEVIALVTGIDVSGQYCTIAIDPHTMGSFPLRRFNLKPAIGDRLAVRYEIQQRNARMQVHLLTAIPASAPCTHLNPRVVTGPLRVMAGKTVGFVLDVYVPSGLSPAQPSLGDHLVTVEAIESWDGVKKKLGWRAFRLTTIS